MTKKNKLDYISEFTEKWLAYQKAASMWILDQESALTSAKKFKMRLN